MDYPSPYIWHLTLSFRSLENLPGLQKCTLRELRPIPCATSVILSQGWLLPLTPRVIWHCQLVQLEGRDSCWLLMDTGQACFRSEPYLLHFQIPGPQCQQCWGWETMFYFILHENVSLRSTSTSAFESPWGNVPWL